MYKYNARIMVIEDDEQILNFLTYTLKNEGLSYVSASKAQEALNKLSSETVDLIILDLGLPDLDGMEVIKRVREWSRIPIIVVSARNQDVDKVQALDNGADDYLTKPFSITELMARIRVALRNAMYQTGRVMQTILSVGDLQIDFDKRLVHLNNLQVPMTPLEYKLLSFLFINSGKVMTTKQIITEVWGTSHGTNTSTLRSLVAGLRRKIEKNPAMPRYILTETGVGYRLMDNQH